jgi:hypothetical protein
MIVGTFSVRFHLKAFVRTPNGTFQFFKVPFESTGAQWINKNDTIVGRYYEEDHHNLERAFVRSPDGSMRTFGCSGGLSTTANRINRNGWIVGGCGNHGFLRTPLKGVP